LPLVVCINRGSVDRRIVEFIDFISIPQVENLIFITDIYIYTHTFIYITKKTKEKAKNYKIKGTLCISGHHLVFSDRQKKNNKKDG
jgi:hypothetical protein